MLVKDWMSKNPVTIKADTKVPDALNILREEGFRRLPVVSGAGVVIGIVTDRDLKEASPSDATSLSVYEVTYLLNQLSVESIMSSPVVYVDVNDSIEKAAKLMQQEKISGLVVLENDNLVGIITITDILAAFIDNLQA